MRIDSLANSRATVELRMNSTLGKEFLVHYNGATSFGGSTSPLVRVMPETLKCERLPEQGSLRAAQLQEPIRRERRPHSRVLLSSLNSASSCVRPRRRSVTTESPEPGFVLVTASPQPWQSLGG